jgi:hypothetical protein
MFSALILTRSIWAMHGDAQRISVAALFIRPFFHLYIKEINLESYPVAFPIVYSISISYNIKERNVSLFIIIIFFGDPWNQCRSPVPIPNK